MKKIILTSILALLIAGTSAMRAQDYPDEYLGLPGDNLNLYAVMNLFQESETLEDFERELNDHNTRINNLDLNGDNMVDYITVTDYVDRNVHTIVLQAVLSRYESQDVAVFTVEQLRNGEVQIQLIGDEALYGRNYIIEPLYAETPNPGYRGNTSNVTVVHTTYYDVARWPVVVHIYRPGYVVWHSSWYWGYYPTYWTSWHPYYWHYYYGYHYNYYNHYFTYYHHCTTYRSQYYHNHYYTHTRTYSPQVSVRMKEGRYKSTYSHPEERRRGEEQYASVNSGQDRRTTTRTPNGNAKPTTTERTTNNGNTSVSNTVNTQRAGSATNRTVTRTPSKPGTTNTVRTKNTAIDRTATTRTSSSSTNTRNVSTTQRSTSTPTVNRSSSTRSSSSAAPARSTSRPSTTAQVTRTASSSRSSGSAARNTSRSTSR
ncbi:MAG: hypothetical protein JXB49_00265 [Bacteroidales bacterium]|nr:hypothetical protein [Bacteroidales bacterium]